MSSLSRGTLTKHLHGMLGGAGLSQMAAGGDPTGPTPTRGPELMTTPFSAWTLGDPSITADDTGIVFTSTPGGANARTNIITHDDTVYEVIWTVALYTAGGMSAHLYGPTAAHHGSGETISANTVNITQQIITTGPSSIISQVRFIAVGATSLKITACSIKEVLN